MANVIDIKPYIQFIHGEYKAIKEDEFLNEHSQLKRLLPYLYKKQGDYFDKEAEKLIKMMDKTGK